MSDVSASNPSFSIRSVIYEANKLNRRSSSRKFKLPNAILLFLITFFYITANVLFIVQSNVNFSLLAMIMLTQSMVWAWYLSHDCAHGLVFKKRKSNIALGELLNWLNGMSCTSFIDFQRDHIIHHMRKIDSVGFDISNSLRKMPYICSRLLLICEYYYIPICFYFVKFKYIEYQLKTSAGGRIRVILYFTCNIVFLFCIASNSLINLVLFISAIFLKIHIVRFVDAFQHTYNQFNFPSLPEKVHDKNYEQHHTFSIPVARKWKFLNLIILNFGYHNIHHAVPSYPWYLLPVLDKKLPPSITNSISFSELLIAYHKSRVKRIFSRHPGKAYNRNNKFSLERFTGAYSDKLLG